MFSALVSLLFFRLTGTSGYSASAGSSHSQAQSKPESVRSSASSFSAGTQPCMTTTSSVASARSAASDIASLASSRSAASFNSSRRAAFSTIAALSASFSRPSLASAALQPAVHCFAGPLIPAKDWAVKSKPRSTSWISARASFMQTIITYEAFLSALTSKSSASSVTPPIASRTLSSEIFTGREPSRTLLRSVPSMSSGMSSGSQGTSDSITARSRLSSAPIRLR